uniref:GrpB family protein n=1 Tax=Brachybacterium sp. GPGPB12 TaxID=3023517 RepID=UPI00404B1AAE
MASRAHTVVEQVPHDPERQARFAESAAFPEAEIAHVGSTSLPGLPSRHTIDRAAVVDCLMDERRAWRRPRSEPVEASR